MPDVFLLDCVLGATCICHVDSQSRPVMVKVFEPLNLSV